MPRYILVCHNSGYIVADSESYDTPQALADALYADLGEDLVYHAYLAPASFPPVKDGQDQATIDAMDLECKYLGLVNNK